MKHFESSTILTAYLRRLRGDKISFLTRKSRDRNELEKDVVKLRTITKQQFCGYESEQIEIALRIWKILVVNALGQISISKYVRGFGNLYEYYKQSVRFEDVLFGVDSSYRDHTLHALWVYFLGEYILNHSTFLKGMSLDWYIVVPRNGTEKSKNTRCRIEEKLENYRDAVYCIVALCHDIAYPFEKAEKVNRMIDEISQYMGIQSFERLQYGFSQEQSALAGELLELISQRVVIKRKGTVSVVKDDPTFVDMSQSLEQHRHGILSSYLLYRLIDTIGETTFTKIDQLPEAEDRAVQLLLRRTILHAIASHTSDYAYSVVYNNLRFLLSLFDELEEFSRYKRLGREEVNEICKCGFEVKETGKFSIEYLFEKNHVGDSKKFFLNRAIRFCRMIDVIGGEEYSINEVEMSCVDRRRNLQKQYSLRINRNGVSMKRKRDSKNWTFVNPDPETKMREAFG